MSRRLYLHRTVDVNVNREADYAQRVVEFDAGRITEHGLELIGCWHAVGGNGPWPQVVSLWDIVGGWEGWESFVRTTGLERDSNQVYAEWKAAAGDMRRGGYDRIMGAVPGCPTFEDLAGDPPASRFYVQELMSVRPGSAIEFLAAVRQEAAPIMADHGYRLVGLWEVLFADDEVGVLWSVDVEAHALAQRSADAARGLAGLEARDSIDGALGDSGKGDQRLLDWSARLAAFGTKRERRMLSCHPGCMLFPAADI